MVNNNHPILNLFNYLISKVRPLSYNHLKIAITGQQCLNKYNKQILQFTNINKEDFKEVNKEGFKEVNKEDFHLDNKMDNREGNGEYIIYIFIYLCIL